jgi:hypothetical protein
MPLTPDACLLTPVSLRFQGRSGGIFEKSSFLKLASRFVIGIRYSISAIVARFPT